MHVLIWRQRKLGLYCIDAFYIVEAIGVVDRDFAQSAEGRCMVRTTRAGQVKD